MPFGAHQYFKCGDLNYITILRNPVERIISHYYYIKRNPDHYLYRKITDHNYAVDDIIKNKLSTEFDNGQTRLLASDFAGIDDQAVFGKVDDLMYQKTINNIDKHFMGVYISELFDESVLLLKKQLGWEKNPFYKKRNVTIGRPSKKNQ